MNAMMPMVKVSTDELMRWYKTQDELHQMIFRHACIGGGGALIPLPFAGEAVCVANQLTMYRRINKMVGVHFSEHVLRNLAQFMLSQGLGIGGGLATVVGVTALAKFIPVVGPVLSVVEAPAAAIATYVCGATYASMLKRMVAKGGLDENDAKKTLQLAKESMPSDSEIKDIRVEAKKVLKGVDLKAFKDAKAA